MTSFLEQQMNEASLLMSEQMNEESILPTLSPTSDKSDNDDAKDGEYEKKEGVSDELKYSTNLALEVTSFLEKQMNDATMIVGGQYDGEASENAENPKILRDPDESDIGSENNSAVLKLAKSLGPSMRELDAVLEQRPTDLNSYHGDDDSFGGEIRHLEASEHLLQQEIEFAHDFGSIINMDSDLGDTSDFLPSPNKRDGKEKYISNDKKCNYEKGIKHKAEIITNGAKSDETENETPDPAKRFILTRKNYTVKDHAVYLQLKTEPRGGWYYRPLSFDSNSGREYMIPIPEKELSRLYVGLQSSSPLPLLSIDSFAKKKSSDSNHPPKKSSLESERLPIRTVGFQLRPDVLVGAVIDAMYHVLTEEPFSLELHKRQGGHLIMQSLVFEFDFQVVCYKGSGSRLCERTLLLRIFYLRQNEVRAPPPNESHFTSMGDEIEYRDLNDNEFNWNLREASALIQKKETSRKDSDISFFLPFKNNTYPSKEAMQSAITQQLLERFKPCPTVASGNLTLPALSRDDWPWVQYTYRYLLAIWDELEDRDLTYSTLRTSSFGQFPCLTTLDVHYVSQLRRLSRESMVLSMLRSASELEQYAREAEITCANLIQTLKASFHAYKLAPPSLPQALPLMAYPLTFTPHQALFPPWGQKVAEALNEVTKRSAEQNSVDSFTRAKDAVQLILEAFQIQHDEEQSARLGRKNVQVMDRLAKMQAHKQASIEKLLQSYSRSPEAKRAAEEFHELAKKAKYGSDPLPDIPVSDHVPLFKCSVLVGGSTGSCFITANHILCATQLVPLVGGSRIKLLELRGLTLDVGGKDGSPSLLNPLPVSLIGRRDGKEVISFRPSYPALRLKAFLELIQAFGEDSKAGYMTRHDLLSIEEDENTEAEENDNTDNDEDKDEDDEEDLQEILKNEREYDEEELKREEREKDDNIGNIEDETETDTLTERKEA